MWIDGRGDVEYQVPSLIHLHSLEEQHEARVGERGGHGVDVGGADAQQETHRPVRVRRLRRVLVDMRRVRQRRIGRREEGERVLAVELLHLRAARQQRVQQDGAYTRSTSWPLWLHIAQTPNTLLGASSCTSTTSSRASSHKTLCAFSRVQTAECKWVERAQEK